MSGIVCAIRGGPASQPTIARAIRLAQETGQPIHFLYVVDMDFLTRTSTSRVQLLSYELEQMGEFILLTAQTKAQAQDVTANGFVRHGRVREQMVKLCKEVDAAYVVMGKPREGSEKNVFTDDRLQRFVDVLQQETRVEIVFAEGDSG